MGNIEHQTISALTRNLEDTLDITSVFIKMLQEEMVVTANFRGKIEQSLINVQTIVDNLQSIINGHDGLLTRVSDIEFAAKEIEKEIAFLKRKIDRTIAEEKAEETKKKERFWSFLIQNSTVILTWLGVVIGLILQFFGKKFGWF